jgi:hypothetical protein
VIRNHEKGPAASRPETKPLRLGGSLSMIPDKAPEHIG